MKLKIFSDLHLEFCKPDQTYFVGEGDVLILAGDILCAKHLKTSGYKHKVYKNFLSQCSRNYNDIIYVKGNHECYGYSYDKTQEKILNSLPKNFHLLEQSTVSINNWNFIGMTMWTDFRNENPIEMWDAKSYMNDYNKIRITPKYRKLNPDDVLAIHKKSKNYLLEQLKTLDNVIVITHHAPSYQSIAEKFKTESSACYVNNFDSLIIEHPQIKYWFHGHVHSFFDYMIEQCRVICNPGGYPGEYTGFNPDFTLEV